MCRYLYELQAIPSRAGLRVQNEHLGPFYLRSLGQLDGELDVRLAPVALTARAAVVIELHRALQT